MSYADSQKVKSGRGAQKSGDLYQNGLKSTALVIKKTKDTVMQPMLDEAAKRDARLGVAPKDPKGPAQPDDSRLVALKTKEKRLRASQATAQEGAEEDSEEERKRQAFDALSDGGVPEYEIGEKGKEVLAKEDRNYLVRQKTHE